MRRFQYFVSIAITIVPIVICPFPSKAQTQNGNKVPYIIEGQDTVPVVNLPPVNITDFGLSI